MTWLVFSYSLPSKAQSSPRVALWRRLRRLGAITLTGVSLSYLPVRKTWKRFSGYPRRSNRRRGRQW